MTSRLLIYFIFFLICLPTQAKLVQYTLNVNSAPVNLSGKKSVDFAIQINGRIPAPTLEFTEGDEAEITVVNNLNEEASIHWHGILLPPEEDGVAYVNTPPIFAGQSRTFRFKIRQHGTYWYHSHTMLQEQKGVYGAFIIHPKLAQPKADKNIVVILSDWTDENPDQVLRNLRKDGDFYLYKKDSRRSYWGALKAHAIWTFLADEWNRMGGMDLSDVGYDAFLMNGQRTSQLLSVHPGKKIRLRVINAAASSYFYLSLAGQPFKVIAADGVDVKPVMASEILMGMAETYDILFEMPEHKNYELRATAQDGTGYSSSWIGMGEKVFAPNRPKPDLYAPMDHSSHHTAAQQPTLTLQKSNQHHGHEHHHQQSKATPDSDAKKVIETLTVDNLEAINSTMLKTAGKTHEVKLVLGGDMERYVWHINNRAIFEDRLIEIDEGDIVRFTFVNDTMMHHPMHLHGHFFRVLNEFQSFSPLKHTVDVGPHSTRTIEFLANEPGQWMLHCHNLYHMKTGMARIVKYSSFTPRPEMLAIQNQDPHLHDHWYHYGQVFAASNYAEMFLRTSQTWNQLEVKLEGENKSPRGFDTDAHWESSGDFLYRRWFSNYLNLFTGASLHDERGKAVIGAGYLFPLLVESNIFLNEDGQWRVDLHKQLHWTKNFSSDLELSWRPNQEAEEETEVHFSLMYSPSWYWSAGAFLTGNNMGLGLKIQF